MLPWLRKLSACLWITLALGIAACSPGLNWRTVQSPDEQYTALFPAKPDKMERRVPFQDQEIFQVLQGAKAGDDIFSISAYKLNPQQSALKDPLLLGLQSNVLKQADSSSSKPTEKTSYYETTDRQRMPVKDTYLLIPQGQAGQQRTMRVRWIARMNPSGATWIYQVSILHTGSPREDAKALLANEEYSSFFEGFHPN